MKSPKDVLALGRVIVRELELAARGTVLQRWMAHHLAETLAGADSAEEEAKADAEARAVKLILELWRHRRALPNSVDPLAGVRETIDILSRMAPETNPWRHARDERESALLRETFDVLAKVVVLGAILPGRQRRQPSPEEVRALSVDERHLLKTIERWVPYAREASKPRWKDLLLADTDHSSDPGSNRAELEMRVAQERDKKATAVRDKIVHELRGAKTALKKLIKQWEGLSNVESAKTDQHDPE